MFLFFVVVIMYQTHGVNFPQCSPPERAAKPIIFNGEEKVLIVGAGNWDAPGFLARIAQIILNEHAGVQADFSNAFGGSADLVSAITGCVEHNCTNIKKFPDVHFDFENWYTSRGGAIIKAHPLAMKHGFIGYDGQEGLYMRESIAHIIWDSLQIPIDYYQTMRRPDRPWGPYFNMPATIAIPRDSGCRNETAKIMKAEGLHCDPDGWWYSPACKDDKDSCIPVLMGGVGWLGIEATRVVDYNRIPMAVTFLDWPDQRIVNGESDALFFWWKPDWSYLGLGPVRRVLFPIHNRYEWAQGVYKTDFPDFQLNKYMWAGMEKVSYRAASLFENFHMTWQGINEFMAEMFKRSGEGDPDLIFTLACEWVQANGALWKTWFPAVPPCAAGFGVVDSDCSICPAGSLSVQDVGIGNRLCKPCPAGLYCNVGEEFAVSCPPGHYCPEGSIAPVACDAGQELTVAQGKSRKECRRCVQGTYSPSAGSAVCSNCNPGMFTNVSGETGCQHCIPGSYQDESGQTKCRSCVEGMYSPKPAASKCADCEPGRYSDAGASTACTLCGAGAYQDASSQTQCRPCRNGQTTRLLGSFSAEDCLCSPGTYHGRNGTCVHCTLGMICDDFGMLRPLQKEGYFVLNDVSRGYPVFRCAGKVECVAGNVETCGDNRQQELTCANCDAGYYKAAKGECMFCDGVKLDPKLIIFCSFGILAMGLAHIVVNSPLATLSRQGIVGFLILGLALNLALTFNLYGSLDMLWVSPLLSGFRFIEVLALDLDAFRFSCLTNTDSMLPKYMAKVFAPLLILLVLVVICAFSQVHPLSRKRIPFTIPALQNTVGLMFSLFFIAVSLLSLEPFVCVSHPSGQSTIAADRSVECWNSKEHRDLVSLSVGAIVLYPASYLALTGFLTYQHVALLTRFGGRYMARTRFLFARFRPNSYYFAFVLTVRNFLLALTPVLFTNRYGLQVFSLMAITIFWLVIQMEKKPWHFIVVNNFDTFATSMQVLVLLCFSLLPRTPSSDNELKHFEWGLIILVLVSFAVLSLTAAGVHVIASQYLRSKRYGIFLSHHKEAAGMFCRQIKLQLQAYTTAGIFFDVDDLQALEDLSFTVRSNTENLVIIKTGSFLLRFWCITEMVVAWMNKIPIILVSVTDGGRLSEDWIIRLKQYWSESEKQEFTAAGITIDDIVAACNSLEHASKVRLPMNGSDDEQNIGIRGIVESCQNLTSSKRISHSCSQLKSNQSFRHVYIICDAACSHQICSARICRMLFEATYWSATILIESSQAPGLSYQSAVLVLVSSNLYKNPTSLGMICAAAGEKMLIVTISSGVEFTKPSESWMMQLQEGLVFNEEELKEMSRCCAGISHNLIAESLEQLFKILAWRFNPEGNVKIMEIEFKRIQGRFKHKYSMSATPTRTRSTSEELQHTPTSAFFAMSTTNKNDDDDDGVELSSSNDDVECASYAAQTIVAVATSAVEENDEDVEVFKI